MKTLAVFVLPLLFCSFFHQGNDHDSLDWELAKEKDGIQVFTRKPEGSKLKEMRIKFEVRASFSSIVSLIYDTEAFKDWVYKSNGSSAIKVEDDYTGYYYTVMDFPWPFHDRDVVIFSDLEQDKETKILSVFSEARPDYQPEIEGIIRVKNHFNKWTFTPDGKGNVAVDYFFRSDPEGHVPAWLVNIVVDKGSIHTMSNFIIMLKKEKYAKASLPHIIEH